MSSVRDIPIAVASHSLSLSHEQAARGAETDWMCGKVSLVECDLLLCSDSRVFSGPKSEWFVPPHVDRCEHYYGLLSREHQHRQTFASHLAPEQTCWARGQLDDITLAAASDRAVASNARDASTPGQVAASSLGFRHLGWCSPKDGGERCSISTGAYSTPDQLLQEGSSVLATEQVGREIPRHVIISHPSSVCHAGIIFNRQDVAKPLRQRGPFSLTTQRFIGLTFAFQTSHL